MSLSLRKRGKVYYVRGTVRLPDGRIKIIKERSTGCTREGEAKAFRDALQGQLQHPTKRVLMFAEAVISYIQAGKTDRFLTKLVEELGEIALDEITTDLLNQTGRRVYPHVAPSTLRRQWHGPAIAVINYAKSDRLQRPKDGGSRVYFFTPTQADDLIKSMQKGRYKTSPASLITECLFGTGGRVREVLSIQPEDIFFDYAYVILRNTKNGEERRTTLAERTRITLALSSLTSPVFTNVRGKPYKLSPDRGVRFTWWDRAVRDIGLDPRKYTPHVARHSWATWRYAQTKDTLMLMNEGGWSRLELVQRYVKLASPEIIKESQNLGWIWKTP